MRPYLCVIPAKAGIQSDVAVHDSRFRGNDMRPGARRTCLQGIPPQAGCNSTFWPANERFSLT
jgi:hypothetical protein